MKKRYTIMAIALATTVTARDASGDIYHLNTPGTLKTDGGSEIHLPPGYFLDERTWQERDLEMRRLQEQETRLGAENKSLRKSASEGPNIWFATGVLVIGAFTGFVGYQMLSK